MKKLWIIYLPFLLVLTSCSNIRVLDPKSETAQDQSFLIQFSFALMMIVFATVIILYTVFLLKYRKTEKNKDTIPEEEKGNRLFEISWTALPIVLLIILAIPTITITYKISAGDSATPPNAVHVDVTAQQFSWTFSYQNGVETVGNLVLPKDRPVVFHLNSEDVIHSFWVPRLGGKKDVIPGKEQRLILTPNEVGTYQGKCAEFCGREHTNMRFTTKVTTQKDFQDWLEEKEQKLK